MHFKMEKEIHIRNYYQSECMCTNVHMVNTHSPIFIQSKNDINSDQCYET